MTEQNDVRVFHEDGNGLAQMSKQWKSAGERMTVFKQINVFRRESTLPDFEATLLRPTPSNVDTMAWTDAIAAFNASLEEFNRKTNYDFDAASAMREVAFELENESRRGYDKMTERYVEFLRGLQNCGQLESQMAELEPALLSVVRAGVTRVPQLELQARTSR